MNIIKKQRMYSIFLAVLFSMSLLFARHEPDERGHFNFDGATRKYQVYLPQNFQPDMPLIVALHGRWMDMTFFKEYIRMHEVSDTMGYVLVYAEGMPWAVNSWNAGVKTPPDYPQNKRNDTGFLSALIDTIKKDYDIDLTRVFFCGYCLGGSMAIRMAGEYGHRLAGIAAVSSPLGSIAETWQHVQPTPVWYVVGTADIWIPYDGNINSDRWPVRDVVDYWAGINQCSGEADTVYIPDIVAEDNCTLQKISFGNCGNGNQVVHYKGINMGHSWPGTKSELTAIIEPPRNQDMIANVEMLRFFNRFENPLVNLAWAKSVQNNPRYIPPQGAKLVINSLIHNPHNHEAAVEAIISATHGSFKDSLQLFDDGMHQDSLAADNIWGNSTDLSDLEEDMYSIAISTYDIKEDLQSNLKPVKSFTTMDPFKFEVGLRTKDAYPWKLMLSLTNGSSEQTALNIRAELTSPDTNIYSIKGFPVSSYGNMAPSQTTNKIYNMYFINPPESIPLELHIYSDNILYWIYPIAPDAIMHIAEKESLPLQITLQQNYPNPFNPVTTISYTVKTLHGASPHVDLSIYNLLGQRVATLVDKKQVAGEYRVQWDASGFASGIYIYTMETSNGFMQSRKLVLLK